jgi:hypothetical protein
MNEKRQKAIQWLGDRWLLAVPVTRPERPVPPHLETRGKALARERDWRAQGKAKAMQGAVDAS